MPAGDIREEFFPGFVEILPNGSAIVDGQFGKEELLEIVRLMEGGDAKIRKVALCRHGYPPGMCYICK